MSDEELCNECGRSVAWGSGLFVNRVPCFDLDGGWICRECDETMRVGEEIGDGMKFEIERKCRCEKTRRGTEQSISKSKKRMIETSIPHFWAIERFGI